jgi:hypothetical protein
MLHAVRFANGIAPASPIQTEPIVSLDPGFRFELEFSKWGAAVGLGGALDFLENVQFGHRHSILGCHAHSAANRNATPFLTSMPEIL